MGGISDKLDYILFCDGMVPTFGKLNLIGIFGRIRLRKLPSQHPQMAIVARLKNLDPGRHSVELKFRHADGSDALPPVEGKVVVPEGDVLGEAGLNVLFANFPILRQGIVTVGIHVDGCPVGGRDLFIELVKET